MGRKVEWIKNTTEENFDIRPIIIMIMKDKDSVTCALGIQAIKFKRWCWPTYYHLSHPLIAEEQRTWQSLLHHSTETKQLFKVTGFDYFRMEDVAAGSLETELDVFSSSFIFKVSEQCLDGTLFCRNVCLVFIILRFAAMTSAPKCLWQTAQWFIVELQLMCLSHCVQFWRISIKSQGKFYFPI